MKWKKPVTSFAAVSRLFMDPNVLSDPDAPALVGLRRRGQFLISGLLWGAAAGVLVLFSGYALFLYHYALAFAERLRTSFGVVPPTQGPDWFMLCVIAAGPGICLVCIAMAYQWYRRIWFRRLQRVWPDARDRSRYSSWQDLPLRVSVSQRERRNEHLSALLNSDLWAVHRPPESSAARYEERAEWVLAELEKDIAERALTTGLTVGISSNQYVDLFTIFTAALELQLHVLSRLGKRPSFHAWRLLIQRCGASLFINSYLNRQDS